MPRKHSTYSTRASLIFRLKDRRDDDSWQQFCDHYEPYIFSIAAKMGVRDADLDDVVQQVMIKTWKALPDFDYDSDAGRFKNWLAQVTRNVVLPFLRNQRRDESKHREYGQEKQFDNDDEFLLFADKQWKITMGKMAWENIQDNFAGEAQQIFELMSQGVKNIEIADQLEMKQNTVAASKKRLIAALQKEVVRLHAYLA